MDINQFKNMLNFGIKAKLLETKTRSTSEQSTEDATPSIDQAEKMNTLGSIICSNASAKTVTSHRSLVRLFQTPLQTRGCSNLEFQFQKKVKTRKKIRKTTKYRIVLEMFNNSWNNKLY